MTDRAKGRFNRIGGPNALPMLCREIIERQQLSPVFLQTGNLRAVLLLLGHTKLESTVRYLGIEVDDALQISEQNEL
jgi:hypothetical protein